MEPLTGQISLSCRLLLCSLVVVPFCEVSAWLVKVTGASSADSLDAVSGKRM